MAAILKLGSNGKKG
jgi:hypothetical protein